MAISSTLTQDPSQALELALDQVLENETEYVLVRGKRFGLGDIKKGTIRFFTHLQMEDSTKDESDTRLSAKIAAAIVVNSWWGYKAFFGLWWRIVWMWFYYVKEYSERELLGIVRLGKKKAEKETAASTLITILVTAMRDTTMRKTAAEAKHSQVASTLEKRGAAAKSSSTSQPADTSSESGK